MEEKAVAFFTQAGLSRFLAVLREKYEQVGHIGGQVIIEESTPAERRNIASFLGKPLYTEDRIKVRLTDVERALQHSFHRSLPDVLNAFFPDQPLVTRPQQRQAHAQHQANFHTALTSIMAELPAGSRGRLWLAQGPHGLDWLFSRYKNASSEEQECQLALIHYIANVLDRLPAPDAPQRLAIFAQNTSGDPHALDPDRAEGRLLLLALGDLQYDDRPTSPQDREQTLRLYNNAGLLVDTISSSVAVFNPVRAICTSGSPDPLVEAASKRVLLLPLRQLLEWEHVTPASSNIYVFENPQVFEEIVATQESAKAPPTLICTSGWPSMAALLLLDCLLANSSTNHLFYSGDFDLKGLQIAAYFLARYADRCSPWRFDPATYLLALQASGLPARSNELAMLNTLPAAFSPLVKTMQEKQLWAYQEGIISLLAEDVQSSRS